MQCALRALVMPGVKGIFFSTSPPLVGTAAVLVASLRRIPTAYWAMDLNPDQLIAMGKLKESDWSARLLEAVNRFILMRTGLVVALDRFMAERLRARGVPDSKLVVMPPWPHEEHLDDMPPEKNPFRARHGLSGKFVVMYSGNHSPANPLKTLLEAAVRLRTTTRWCSCSSAEGWGSGRWSRTLASGAKNIVSLPYQPLAELGNSLSAADVHVVSLGDEMVGIVHPCKIYGAMTVGRPILFFGPRPSHVADLLDEHRIGERVAHGDVAAAVSSIQTLRGMDRATLARMGEVGRQVVRQRLSQKSLSREFCDHLERVFGRPTAESCKTADSFVCWRRFHTYPWRRRLRSSRKLYVAQTTFERLTSRRCAKCSNSGNSSVLTFCRDTFTRKFPISARCEEQPNGDRLTQCWECPAPTSAQSFDLAVIEALKADVSFFVDSTHTLAWRSFWSRATKMASSLPASLSAGAM